TVHDGVGVVIVAAGRNMQPKRSRPFPLGFRVLRVDASDVDDDRRTEKVTDAPVDGLLTGSEEGTLGEIEVDKEFVKPYVRLKRTIRESESTFHLAEGPQTPAGPIVDKNRTVD